MFGYTNVIQHQSLFLSIATSEYILLR